MNQYLLVMTACIDPSAGHYPLVRSDPKIRLEDYRKALRYWLALPDQRISRILFIENSNYPLDSLKETARAENPLHKQVEFISLDCNWYPPGGHYGYAELKMIDLGLQQSKLRAESTHMIKVSGRFIFPALTKLLNRLPASFDAATDVRAWYTPFRRRDQPFVTTQIVLFHLDFYTNHLQQSWRWLESGPVHHMEVIFYNILAESEKTGDHSILFRFPCNVDPVGFPAHRVGSYQKLSRLMTNTLRAVARRIAPAWRL